MYSLADDKRVKAAIDETTQTEISSMKDFVLNSLFQDVPNFDLKKYNITEKSRIFATVVSEVDLTGDYMYALLSDQWKAILGTPYGMDLMCEAGEGIGGCENKNLATHVTWNKIMMCRICKGKYRSLIDEAMVDTLRAVDTLRGRVLIPSVAKLDAETPLCDR